MQLSATLAVVAMLVHASAVGPAHPPLPPAARASVPPRPAPAPPAPPPSVPVPPPPPPDEDALWREVDRLVALEEAEGTGPAFNFTDFNGVPVPPEGAQRCEHAVRQALHQQRLKLGPRIYTDQLTDVTLAHKDHPDDPRIVYFVMLSRSSSHLTVSRLIHATYHPAQLYLLHLDLKLDSGAADAIGTYVRNLRNVHQMRTRRLVQWGSFTMVAVMLDAMRTIVELSLDFDFFINLSDADVALRTNTELVAWLRPFRAGGYSMLQMHGAEGELIERTLRFAQEHPVVECGGYGLAAVSGKIFDITPTPYCCFGRSGPVIYQRVDGLEPPTWPDGAKLTSGSQWAVLHRRLVDFIVRDPVARQWAAVFERRVLPDEMFLQTVLAASPFADAVVGHNMRWIDWPHYHGDPGSYWATVGWNFVGGPRVLTVADAPAVFASPFIFARKVDPNIDSEILHKWDAWMGKKLAGQPTPYQLPIGEDIARQDPGVRNRYAAADAAPGSVEPPGELPARMTALPAVAAMRFADGSSCRCGEACRSYGDCCDTLFPRVCAAGGGAAGGGGGAGASGALSACPRETAELRSFDTAPAERDVSFQNSAPYAVQLLVLGLDGAEVPMGVLQPHGQLLTFAVARQHAWRVRTLGGRLMLEVAPSARPLRRYEVVACDLSAPDISS